MKLMGHRPQLRENVCQTNDWHLENSSEPDKPNLQGRGSVGTLRVLGGRHRGGHLPTCLGITSPYFRGKGTMLDTQSLLIV